MMRRVRALVVWVALLAIGCTLTAAPAAAYCNTNPCLTNRHLVCTMCTYYAPIGGSWCRVTVIYCVHCPSGDILSWDENIDYCTYGAP